MLSRLPHRLHRGTGEMLTDRAESVTVREKNRPNRLRDLGFYGTVPACLVPRLVPH
jgi:hypothetical protein